MAQNNTAILYDVSTCLRDAMDSVFTNGYNIIIPGDNNMNFDIPNNGGLSPTDTLNLMINKRKQEANLIMNGEIECLENGNHNTKRICTMNSHHQHEQKQ